MVSSEQYSYSEVLEMLPFERDVFLALIQDDAAKAAKNSNGPHQPFM